MRHETELPHVREQAGMLAEQVGRLLDMIARRDSAQPAEGKTAVLESLMKKLRARQRRLKASAGKFRPVKRKKPG